MQKSLKGRRWLTLTVLFLALTFVRGWAQTDTARVEGTVTDATGASVPGATVTIKNLQNNAVTTVTSGGNGDFTASALEPGTYQATVTVAGFASEVQNFKLDVSQVQPLNFK